MYGAIIAHAMAGGSLQMSGLVYVTQHCIYVARWAVSMQLPHGVGLTALTADGHVQKHAASIFCWSPRGKPEAVSTGKTSSGVIQASTLFHIWISGKALSFSPGAGNERLGLSLRVS
jgi:hypothetical protein